MTYAKSGLFWSMFPSFPRYKEGTGGREQIETGPSVLTGEDQRVRISYIIDSICGLN